MKRLSPVRQAARRPDPKPGHPTQVYLFIKHTEIADIRFAGLNCLGKQIIRDRRGQEK